MRQPPVTAAPTRGQPRRSALLVLALLVSVVSGCRMLAGPPPPVRTREQIEQELRSRSDAFRSVVDTDISLTITTELEGEAERSPRLGGLIAFDRRLPGLWLRAEKLGRKVFSLRAVDMRFSLVLPETGELVTGGPTAYARLPHLVRPDEVQTMFSGPDGLGISWPGTRLSRAGEQYLFEVEVLGRPYRRIYVDRRTADVRVIERYDVMGRRLTRIELSEYEPTPAGRFPRRLLVERPRQGTKVELGLGDPTLNKDIPPRAFQPHAGAGLKHIDLDRQPLSAVEAFRGE